MPEYPDTLLLPGQAAARLGVDRRTLLRWAQAGLLPASSTPGGYRRYRAGDIHALQAGTSEAVETVLMSRRRVIERFDITDRALRHLWESGRLPSILLPGGHRRFRLEDVQAALQDRAERRATLPRGYAGGTGSPR